MTDNVFYTIAAAVMRERKNCKYKPTRHCVIIRSDKECVACVEAKVKAMRAAK